MTFRLYKLNNDDVDVTTNVNGTSDNNDEDDTNAHDEERQEVLEARSKWAMIHFYVLRPAFSLSLLLYMASLTSANGALTLESGVVTPIRYLTSLVRMESDTYIKCVKQSSVRTKKSLQKLAGEDRERAENLFDSNKFEIERAEELASTCFGRIQKARCLLIRWKEDNVNIPWMNIAEIESNSSANKCTAGKRNKTEQLLGRDFRIAEEQLTTALDDFVSGSHSSLKAIEHYAMNRFDYDRNYFIMERVQPALDYLSEQSTSIQMMGIVLDYNVTEIESMIKEQLQNLQRHLEQAKKHIDTLKEKLQEFRNSISDLYVNYNALYGRMAEAASILHGFLPPGVALPEVFDLSDLPLADSFLPSTGLNLPEIELEYKDIQQNVQKTAQACLNLVVEILDDAQTHSLQDLREAAQRIAQALTEILALKDYDPPRFQGSRDDISDIDQEIELHSLLGKEVINWTARAFENLRIPPSAFDNITFDEVNTPEFDSFDYNMDEDTSTTFELLSIIIPKLTFIEQVLRTVALLGGYAFVLDIFCGFFHWWRISSMYESGAMPNMPEINYGDDAQDGRERPRTNYRMVFFIFKSLLNPIVVGFLCMFSLFTFLVVTFWIPHVEQMCVHSSNGTWFANNMLAPTLTNIAMAEGNTQYLLAEHSCHSLKNQLCTKIGTEVEKRISTDLLALRSFQAKHNRSLEAWHLMRDCINTSKMTDIVTESCCGLKGYKTAGCLSSNYVCPIDFSTTPPSAYSTLSTYLDSSSCQQHVNEWKLQDEKFECTSLGDACNHIPCSGVNDEWIRKYTTQMDCRVELWIIGSCRFWYAVILHFSALYTTCTLIYLGCRDIHWREISPDSIRFRTLLRESGKLAKGEEVQERLEFISKEIQWFERKARLQVIMGSILLSAYVVVVLILAGKR